MTQTKNMEGYQLLANLFKDYNGARATAKRKLIMLCVHNPKQKKLLTKAKKLF
jgi:hypothetical protein